MPRMSEAEKAKSHQRILEAAVLLFHKQGIAETSLAEIMAAAGMTHGGFYRHFKDKQALVAKMLHFGMDRLVADIERAEGAEARAAARQRFYEAYLSEAHLNTPGLGCPISALASELARSDGEIREESAAAVTRLESLLDEDGQGGAARLAVLLGAVSMARLTADEAKARAVLKSARAALEQL